MKKHFLLLIAILVPLALVVFYYEYYNPDNQLSIQCGLYKMTGFLCPGCGGQRAFHHLLHGEIISALKHNAIFILGFPFLAYLYFACVKIYIFKDEKYHNSFVFSSSFGYSFIIILLVYFIIRNIPIWPFTYLLPN